MALIHLPQVAFLTNMLPLNKTPSSVAAIISKNFNAPSFTVQCKASSSARVSDQTQQVSRRSGDFQPDVWRYDYIQSLNNNYTEQAYKEESRKLMAEVRILLSETVNRVDQLELIDTLQRLGLGYQFKSEINKILENIYNVSRFNNKLNLHATALEFRLLRQHGYDVSPDVFGSFNNEEGDFQTTLSQDIKGMLSLYEASFHLMEDETILEKATNFTSKSLKDFVSNNTEHELTSQVKHALELPLHWRLPRWEARWFIGEYERMPNMNPTILQLAKLDYNMVQAMYQEEVKSNFRWWERTGLEKKVNFFRCRVVGSYVWSLGIRDEPHAGNLRRVIGKLCATITLTDDLYDVHGTLEELELFTQAISRWDTNDLGSLPEYMKVAFFAIYDFVDELASDIQREKGLNVDTYLKKGWQDMCKAFMVEARWYHGGKTPSLKEYLENAWVSIGGHNYFLHTYLTMPNNSIKKQDLDFLDQRLSNLPYLAGLNFRLLNDIGSFKREQETGDVSSAIQCHMNDTGASEEEAIEHVKSLIYKTWQKTNQEVATSSSSFPRDFNVTAWGLARSATFHYHYGDDPFTYQDSQFKERLRSLLFEPIPI
ncbi:(+)-epi-alpha-bisabolol synthase-like [Prosopis cineraria]|uniref:(+)-epi-alpha-bisabolol synthase-like n=1 Tax=Prosopis cineraria TaxID=364024 RepID=UPI00240EB920|nr:(+)-epi-alpha-bisabolol synthase-like [Prosopis cineraria]